MAVYGIDLGTTYSSLATVGADGAPEVLPLMDGSRTLPSVVLFVGADDHMTQRAHTGVASAFTVTAGRAGMRRGSWGAA